MPQQDGYQFPDVESMLDALEEALSQAESRRNPNAPIPLHVAILRLIPTVLRNTSVRYSLDHYLALESDG
jgi:hypothetical protein